MQVLVGVDEAGRGAWAGPVFAAAVHLKKGTRLPGLKDSKLLSLEQREVLFQQIQEKCLYGIGFATAQEVDDLGLLKATHLAMKRAVEAFPVKIDHLQVDGRDGFQFEVSSECIVKGDSKVRAISAASILAKVSRDRVMTEYAKIYPEYSFEKHKGYGTKKHQDLLKTHGVCPIHRRSYKPIQNYV